MSLSVRERDTEGTAFAIRGTMLDLPIIVQQLILLAWRAQAMQPKLRLSLIAHVDQRIASDLTPCRMLSTSTQSARGACGGTPSEGLKLYTKLCRRMWSPTTMCIPSGCGFPQRDLVDFASSTKAYNTQRPRAYIPRHPLPSARNVLLSTMRLF